MADTGWKVKKSDRPLFVRELCEEVGYSEKMIKVISEGVDTTYHLVVGENVVSEVTSWMQDWIYAYTPKEFRSKGYAKKLAEYVIRKKDLRTGTVVNREGKQLVESVLKGLSVKDYKKYQKKSNINFEWVPPSEEDEL